MTTTLPRTDLPRRALLALTGPDAAAPSDPALQAVLDDLRPAVLDRTRDAWAALYTPGQALPVGLLHELAALNAAAQGAEELRVLHEERAAQADLVDEPAATTLAALRRHVLLLALSPSLVTAEDLDDLRTEGLDVPGIVLLAQLVAFESYLLRLHRAVSVLAGAAPEPSDGPLPVSPARGRTAARPEPTGTGRPRPTAFTREQLAWEPWVPVPAPEELSEQQRESFARKATTNSVYFRLISLTPALTAARSDLDNAIFLPRDGLPKAERELAAAATSRVNDCIYCASVHARKSAALSRREEDVDRLLAAPLDRDRDALAADLDPLTAGQDARWSAVIAAAAALSRPRPALEESALADLRVQGLADAEVLDLLAAAAFFAWANRLMLSLGEPALPAV